MKPLPKITLYAAAAAMFTFAAYLITLRNGFLEWDDGSYVVENPHIQRIDGAFFRWALFSFHSSNWHPVTWLSHAVDYAVWGLNPAGHHFTNVTVHATVTFMVTMVAYRLITIGRAGGPSPDEDAFALSGAAITGLLFGLHPLHVESVAWIAERKDLLCAMFYLLSIATYLRFARIRKEQPAGPLFSNRSYLACLGLFLLALASKPMAVTLPLILLLIDWYPLGRHGHGAKIAPLLMEKLPFLLLSVASAVITVMAQKSGDSLATIASLPLGARISTALAATAAYLVKMVLPIGLIPYYPHHLKTSLFSLSSILSLLAVTAVTGWCVVNRKEKKFWLAAWGYYLITLLPVIGIVQIGRQSMADRYTYLPSIAPFLLAGLLAATGLHGSAAPAVRKRAAAGTIILLLAAMTAVTIRQTGIWKDGNTLWSSVISHYRGKEKELAGFAIVFNNRAIALHRLGRQEEAVADFSRAIALAPEDTYYLNRGTIFLKDKKYDRALEDYTSALRLNPANKSASYNIACIHSLANRSEEACRWLRESIDHGYDAWESIREDKDLDNIRSTPCYREIMAGR